jgi:hypothetical protein
MIKITTKLSFEEYISINYHMFYSRWVSKVINAFGLFYALLLVISIVFNGSFRWFFIFPVVIFLLGPRVEIYLRSKRNYKSDATIGESIEYQFCNDEIIVTGQSFSSRLSWNTIYKVSETKEWVLIWQNKLVAYPIPKRNIRGDDLKSFREIVNNHKTLKR